MKSRLCLLFCLLSATSAFAERDRFEIVTQYQSFDAKFLAEAKQSGASPEKPDTEVTAPRVTMLDGQKATVEIIREEPIFLGADHKINSGITLEVELSLKDDRIHLTGESTVRHRLDPGVKQPLDAVTFTTRETYFDGDVADGKPLELRVGDGPADPSKITLTVTRLEPKSEVKHAGVPKYRVYAIEPSSEEAKKPIYKQLGIVPPKTVSTDPGTAHAEAFVADSLRDQGYVVGGVFQPAEGSSPGKEAVLAQLKDALKAIPDADLPIKVTAVLGPDGQTLDVKIDPANESVARKVSTNVSVYWGSDIFLTLADTSAPGGRRGLLVRQE